MGRWVSYKVKQLSPHTTLFGPSSAPASHKKTRGTTDDKDDDHGDGRTWRPTTDRGDDDGNTTVDVVEEEVRTSYLSNFSSTFSY